MIVSDVAALFKSYVNESDTAWLTDAEVAEYLAIAYEEFQDYALQYSSEIYINSVDLVLNNQDHYHLDGTELIVVCGDYFAVPYTDPALRSVIAIFQQDTGTAILDPRGHIEVVTSFRSLHGQNRKAYFAGGVLYFSEVITRTLTLYYVPESQVDWTQFPAPAHEYIDDLFPYHDLIALYAAAQYSIRDGEINEPLQAMIERREKKFAFYLQQRGTEDVSFVERVARSKRSYI